MSEGTNHGSGFAFIVVLFILLIIVGASFMGGSYGGGYGGWLRWRWLWWRLLLLIPSRQNNVKNSYSDRSL